MLYHQEPTPESSTAHESQKPDTHPTMCRKLKRLKNISFRQLSWSKSLIDRQAGLRKSLKCFYQSQLGALVNLVSFRDILKLMSCLLPWFQSIPSGWSVSPFFSTFYFLRSFLWRLKVLSERKQPHNRCLGDWYFPRLDFKKGNKSERRWSVCRTQSCPHAQNQGGRCIR